MVGALFKFHRHLSVLTKGIAEIVRDAWFWAGVSLLVISSLVWAVALVVGVVYLRGVNEWVFIIVATFVLTLVPISIGIYGVSWWGRSNRILRFLFRLITILVALIFIIATSVLFAIWQS